MVWLNFFATAVLATLAVVSANPVANQEQAPHGKKTRGLGDMAAAAAGGMVGNAVGGSTGEAIGTGIGAAASTGTGVKGAVMTGICDMILQKFGMGGPVASAVCSLVASYLKKRMQHQMQMFGMMQQQAMDGFGFVQQLGRTAGIPGFGMQQQQQQQSVSGPGFVGEQQQQQQQMSGPGVETQQQQQQQQTVSIGLDGIKATKTTQTQQQQHTAA